MDVISVTLTVNVPVPSGLDPDQLESSAEEIRTQVATCLPQVRSVQLDEWSVQGVPR